MNEHDLEFYRKMIKERDERIQKLEAAIKNATYKSNGKVHVSFYECVDLSSEHPILLEVHE